MFVMRYSANCLVSRIPTLVVSRVARERSSWNSKFCFFHFRNEIGKWSETSSSLTVKASARDNLQKIKDSGEVGSAELYSAAVEEASNIGEWLSAVQFLAEARLLQLTLSCEAIEAASCALASAGQEEKAVEELKILYGDGEVVSTETLNTVARALSRSSNWMAAERLLEFATEGISSEHSVAYNCLARAYARGDQENSARKLFDELWRSDLIEPDTVRLSGSSELLKQLLVWICREDRALLFF
mmetsp:Transcript_10202/g.24345  ORF Transcript_10202/g.24345 Transcript_10202/m.24345 type:complete len:244 (+) Transcript_10202:113-844(+)